MSVPQDSNLEPPRYKLGALTNCARDGWKKLYRAKQDSKTPPFDMLGAGFSLGVLRAEDVKDAKSGGATDGFFFLFHPLCQAKADVERDGSDDKVEEA